MSDNNPSASDLRIVIIGAGMAGILSAIKLREAGYDNFVIYEKSDRLGGTWRDNTYPGIACDVPAHLYTYSFEPNPDWSSTFAAGPEIQGYFERIANKYGVVDRIRFNEKIPYCAFENGRWRIRTESGTEDVADFIIAATGVLHHPHVDEQPFTRSLGGVSVPEGMTSVWIEARDSVHGWTEEKFEVGLE